MNRLQTLTVLLGAACLAVGGCGDGDAAKRRAVERIPSGSLEACVASVGAPAAPPMFEDFEAALKVGGVALSEVVAPREDDYWLAVDFPSEARAQDAANALAPIAAEGMFGALEVRRAGVSVAVVPPTTGPLEEMYSDMPDIKLLRRCTTGFDVVPTEGT